jgi:hypothetical protein
VIIYPQALIASELAAGRPLTHSRIGYQTFTRDLTIAAVTASTEEDEGPRDAPLRPDTVEFWRPTALPATWQLDLGAQESVDYVGIAAHTLGSNAVSILVETSTGAFVGSPSAQDWSTFASSHTPSDDSPIMFLDASRTARYVRITLEGAGGSPRTEDIPRLAVVHVGAVLAMSRPLFGGHRPLDLSRETELHRSLSRGGQFLGQGFRRHGVSGSAEFKHLTASWYRTNFDPFVKAARQYPFFFAWRPQTYTDGVVYAWCRDDIRPSNMGVRDFMQVSFAMQGIGHE